LPTPKVLVGYREEATLPVFVMELHPRCCICLEGQRDRVTDPVTAQMGTLGSQVVQLKLYDPEPNGIVERVNRHLETAFRRGLRLTR